MTISAAVGKENTPEADILQVCQSHTEIFKHIVEQTGPSNIVSLSDFTETICQNNTSTCSNKTDAYAIVEIQFNVESVGLSDSFSDMIMTFKVNYGDTYDYEIDSIQLIRNGITNTLTSTPNNDSNNISFQVIIGILPKFTSSSIVIKLWNTKLPAYTDEEMTINYDFSLITRLVGDHPSLSYISDQITGNRTQDSTSKTDYNQLGYFHISSTHREEDAIASVSVFLALFMILIWVWIFLKFRKARNGDSEYHNEQEFMSPTHIDIKIDDKSYSNDQNPRNTFPSRPDNVFKSQKPNLEVKPKFEVERLEVRAAAREPQPRKVEVAEPRMPIMESNFKTNTEVRGNQREKLEPIEAKGRINIPNIEVKKGDREMSESGRTVNLPVIDNRRDRQFNELQRPGTFNQENEGNLKDPEFSIGSEIDNPSFGINRSEISIPTRPADKEIRGLGRDEEPKFVAKTDPLKLQMQNPNEGSKREIPPHLRASPFGPSKPGFVEEPQLPSMARNPDLSKRPDSLAPVFNEDERDPYFGTRPNLTVENPRPQLGGSPLFQGGVGNETPPNKFGQNVPQTLKVGPNVPQTFKIGQNEPQAFKIGQNEPFRGGIQPVNAGFRADDPGDEIQILANENRWGDSRIRKLSSSSSSSDSN